MNEHEANVERVDALGKSLDNAILDRINALPPLERRALCNRLRSALAEPTKFRIVEPTWKDGSQQIDSYDG